MQDDALIAEARRHVGEFELIKPSLKAGAVAAALVGGNDRVYTGICVELACGIGFCAEHAAVADMLKDRETLVKRIVAVNKDRVVAPCGRCRELLIQIDRRNLECEVLLPDGAFATLRELLPNAWLEHLLVSK